MYFQLPTLSLQIYEEAKFWVPAIAGAWTIFKAISWIQDIKDNHLKHIEHGISEFNTKLDSGLICQTEKIVSAQAVNTNEVKELRDDVKMLTSAILNQTAAKAASVRKKKKL